MRMEAKTLFIGPGSPWENGYIQFFSGKPRDELLSRETLTTPLEAKATGTKPKHKSGKSK